MKVTYQSLGPYNPDIVKIQIIYIPLQGMLLQVI